MQEFYIRKGAVLPILRMDLIHDGRHDYMKFYDAIQNATITFSMVNMETGVTKIAKAPAYIKEREIGGCTNQYAICYDWKERDTKEAGTYEGTFEITFGEIKSDDLTFPKGKLIMPIREELHIIVL